MAETQSSVKDVIPETGGNFHLDENVIAELPLGSKVIEASSYGTSAWTRTARISVQLLEGPIKHYFLKCATEDKGKVMMEGEFCAMSEIYKLMPSLVPQPYAWGKFRHSPPETYFFLLDFLELSNSLVDPTAFCARIAELHLMSRSPTGMFGFPITTCHGPNAQNVEWNSNWCFYFTRLLQQFFYREIGKNGVWPEYEQTFEQLVSYVVPQILEPLQSGGRQLKPSLIHGDLWEENTGTNLLSGEPVVYDSSAMYAHNEFELGMWRREIVRFGKTYTRQYLRNCPPSEPMDQWDDRNRLYSIKYNLAHSIALPGTKEVVRILILNDMRYLVNKYPPLTQDENKTNAVEAVRDHHIVKNDHQVSTDILQKT